ncbi:MAG: hypothetical protein O3C27_10615 [Actinomycetota bacterium]|nr:hypothetical protein [Actinomycetota bacterium]
MTVLANVTAAAVLGAVAEFDVFGRDAFLKKYGFGRSSSYFLVVEDRRYDSKAICGAVFQGDSLSILVDDTFTPLLSEAKSRPPLRI